MLHASYRPQSLCPDCYPDADGLRKATRGSNDKTLFFIMIYPISKNAFNHKIGVFSEIVNRALNRIFLFEILHEVLFIFLLDSQIISEMRLREHLTIFFIFATLNFNCGRANTSAKFSETFFSSQREISKYLLHESSNQQSMSQII